MGRLVPVCFVLTNLFLPIGAFATFLTGQRQLAAATITLWGGELSVYLFATFAVSLSIAQRRGWHLFPVLLVTFATYHLSYGLGFLTGMTQSFSRSDHVSYINSVFSRLTR